MSKDWQILEVSPTAFFVNKYEFKPVYDYCGKSNTIVITSHLDAKSKRIPIQVWSEIKTQEEMNIFHQLQFDTRKFNMIYGNPFPLQKEFFEIRNSGGKTYLVTEINNQDRAGI